MTQNVSQRRTALIRLMLAVLVVVMIGLLFGTVGVLPSHAENSTPTPTNAAPANGWDFKDRVLRVNVLMYHYIDTPPADANYVLKDLIVTPDNFKAQLQWLKDNGYHNITPDDLIEALWHGKPLPSRPVMITFDDGYADAWYNATPILKQFGYTGVFFVITDFINANKSGYLTWDAAHQMAQAGMFIENHTRGHENLKNRTLDFLEDQIKTAQDDIEKHTGYRPRLFCYPYGGYDNRVVWMLNHLGLAGAFTTQHGYYDYAANMMRLPRIRIRGGMDIKAFETVIKDGGDS